MKMATMNMDLLTPFDVQKRRKKKEKERGREEDEEKENLN